jgi:putative oxidoreductase
MPRAEKSSEDLSPVADERFFDSDLVFLRRFAGPIMLVARVLLAYIFVVSGATYIGQYASVVDYMRANGVDARLLPVVIATELGGGLLVLFGLAARWAALALGGFCLLTAFLIHWRANEMIEVQKNVAMAGGFLALAVYGPGPWSLDAWRSRSTPQSRMMQN